MTCVHYALFRFRDIQVWKHHVALVWQRQHRRSIDHAPSSRESLVFRMQTKAPARELHPLLRLHHATQSYKVVSQDTLLALEAVQTVMLSLNHDQLCLLECQADNVSRSCPCPSINGTALPQTPSVVCVSGLRCTDWQQQQQTDRVGTPNDRKTLSFQCSSVAVEVRLSLHSMTRQTALARSLVCDAPPLLNVHED